jgi:tRNA dimethylallyltransferase
LVGPTASGKSELALEAARKLPDIELVSMDSMQIYRGMDIGTAKPTRAEQAASHLHLVDVVDPWETFSVKRFQHAARAAVHDIEARGKRALLVGGTGLYVQSVIDDLRFPGEDLELRRSLEAEAAEPEGLHAAYERLQRLDPTAAARIDSGNTRRIVRALEVIELTGKPFSSFGPGLRELGSATVFPVQLIGLAFPASVLNARIETRVHEMIDTGLVDEVEGLRSEPRGWSRTARQAIGYKEVDAFLGGDEPTLESAIDRVIKRTRSFARRQRAWFARDGRIEWFEVGKNSGETRSRILASWGAV